MKTRINGLTAIVIALTLSFSVALAEESEAYQKGLADGTAFGQKAGASKGEADGKAKGERAGFAKGMEDERTNQPTPANPGSDVSPPAGDPPLPPDIQPGEEPTDGDSAVEEGNDDPAGPPEDGGTEGPAADDDDGGAMDDPAAGPPVEAPQPDLAADESVGAESPQEPIMEPIMEGESEGGPPHSTATDEAAQPAGDPVEDAPDAGGESKSASDALILETSVANNGEMADQLGQEALAEYPDLQPKGSDLSGVAHMMSGDASTQYGSDYSKGFAVGLAIGFGQTYRQAQTDAYKAAFAEAYEKGRAEYRRLHRREDGSVIEPQGQYELGRQAMLLNRYDEAIRRFDIAIAAEGAGDVIPKAIYYKGKAYYQMGKPKTCLEFMLKLLSTYPTSEMADDGYFLVGVAYEKTPSGGLGGFFGGRKYKEARTSYRTLIVRYPDSPILGDAYFRQGYTSQKLKDKAGAIEAYSKLLEKFPDHKFADEARRRLERLRPAE